MSAQTGTIPRLRVGTLGTSFQGVDVAADPGTPILAADRGTVTFAGWSGG